MEYFVPIVFLAVGFVLIIKGGDWFVDSASWMARIAGIPEIIIGATIVSIGTTLPELLTSVTSAIKALADPAQAAGLNAIAVSNSVGSMMCNTGLILALVMLIKPPKTEGKDFVVKGISVLVVCVALCIFAITGAEIKLWEGILLLIMFLIFIGMNIFSAVKDNRLTAGDMEKAEKREQAKLENKWLMIAKFVVGAAAIAVGANLLVDNAQQLCLIMGIPQQIVAVTVVALGTSLPELVTAFTSLKKGTTNIGVGNIIGAHIINATLIVGLISVVSGNGMPIDAITKNVALWVMLGITTVLIVPSIFMKKTTRWQGGVMLAAYLGFITYNIVYVVQNLN